MKLKTILCALALAAAATSCMKGSYQTNFTAYCSFESDDMTVYTKDRISHREIPSSYAEREMKTIRNSWEE